jgi:exodeoxyribonuclease III
MRIVSWNVDGVLALLPRLPALVAELGDPDVLCLQELRVRASDEDAVALLHAALPGYSCGVSLNADRKNASFRGGRAHGVGTWVRSTLGPAHATFPWDREGRVVATQVGGHVVFNVYAVNGTARPYVDPASGSPVGTRYDFKRVFQRLVAGEMSRHRDGLIAIGDWNVSQTAIDTHPRLRTEEPHAFARTELREIAEELALVDAFRALHREARAYTWFNRRSSSLDAARVDFALVSKPLMPSVVVAEIMPLRAESDHAPIVLTMA